MKYIFLSTVLFFSHSALAESFLHIGTPEVQALTEAQSKGQVLLISARILHCLEGNKQKAENAVEFVPCGKEGAEVVFHEKGTMREASDKIFESSKKVTMAYTRPKIVFAEEGYEIQAIPQSNTAETQTSLKITLSKVIQKHVLASVVVTEDRFKMADVVAYFGDEQYVNPTPIPYRRVMTGRQKFKLGETHNITGDMWVELPVVDDERTLQGERQRLYLELTVK